VDTALAKKLLMKADTPFAVVAIPDEHVALLEGGGSVSSAGVVILYATSKAEVQDRLPEVRKSLGPEARLWVAYPKARKLGTDLNRDILAAALRQHGLETVRMVSIDDTWSALWFKAI
jgi:hypothetical protein